VLGAHPSVFATLLLAAAFDLEGHRGARGLAPENTLVAFARALGLGVTTLEMDLAVTRDGVVVVSHDPALNPDITRGPNGYWLPPPTPRILDLTHVELRRYDVGRLRPGTPYASLYPDQVPADGARIPSLRDVYDLTQRAGNEEVRFNIETKIDPGRPELTPPPATFVKAVLDVVRSAKGTDRTMVQSFDWRTLRLVQEMAPEIETVCLTTEELGGGQLERGKPGASPWLGGLDADDHGGSAPRLAAAAKCRVWSPRFRDLSAESLAEAHRLGLRVVPWTANETADMKALIELGVDGIISDRPDRLREAMRQKGLPLPKATPVVP
jgi:glycerophosphoryl diester phosphodiesterase